MYLKAVSKLWWFRPLHPIIKTTVAKGTRANEVGQASINRKVMQSWGEYKSLGRYINNREPRIEYVAIVMQKSYANISNITYCLQEEQSNTPWPAAGVAEVGGPILITKTYIAGRGGGRRRSRPIFCIFFSSGCEAADYVWLRGGSKAFFWLRNLWTVPLVEMYAGYWLIM